MPQNTSFGILLTDTSLEITACSKESSGIHIQESNQCELISPLPHPQNKRLLKNLFLAQQNKTTVVNLGIPTHSILLKTFSIPHPFHHTEIRSLLNLELKAKNSYFLHQTRITEKQIMLLAIEKRRLHQVIQSSSVLGIKPTAIEAEPFALLRLLRKTQLSLLMIQQFEHVLLCLSHQGQLLDCKRISISNLGLALIQEVSLFKTRYPTLTQGWLYTDKPTEDLIRYLLKPIPEIHLTPLNHITPCKMNLISLGLAERDYL